MKNKDNIKQKDYKGTSKILGVVIAIEVLVIIACVVTGVKEYKSYYEMPVNLMISYIEKGEWDSLLYYYAGHYNPDFKYDSEEEMVIATAEYYDHACLCAAAVYAQDENTTEREEKLMSQAYDRMGKYQTYKAQIEEYISEKGAKQ